MGHSTVPSIVSNMLIRQATAVTVSYDLFGLLSSACFYVKENIVSVEIEQVYNNSSKNDFVVSKSLC